MKTHHKGFKSRSPPLSNAIPNLPFSLHLVILSFLSPRASISCHRRQSFVQTSTESLDFIFSWLEVVSRSWRVQIEEVDSEVKGQKKVRSSCLLPIITLCSWDTSPLRRIYYSLPYMIYGIDIKWERDDPRTVIASCFLASSALSLVSDSSSRMTSSFE